LLLPSIVIAGHEPVPVNDNGRLRHSVYNLDHEVVGNGFGEFKFSNVEETVRDEQCACASFARRDFTSR